MKNMNINQINMIVDDIANLVINTASIGNTECEYRLIKGFNELLCNEYNYVNGMECTPQNIENMIIRMAPNIQQKLNNLFFDSYILYINNEMLFIINWSITQN